VIDLTWLFGESTNETEGLVTCLTDEITPIPFWTTISKKND